MLIVIEGPDGAGKTHLANELCTRMIKRLPIPSEVRVLHKGPPFRHPLDEYVTPLLHYRITNDHLICDRWHLGEAVYPRVLARETQWDVAVGRYIELFLRSRGASVQVLAPSCQVIERQVAAGPIRTSALDIILRMQCEDVQRLFREEGERYGRIVYDGTPDPETVIDTAELLDTASRKLIPFVTYVGSPSPKILLLGDVRGVNGSMARGPMPAFAPFHATSGHYLLSHLDVIEHNVGLANAADADDPWELWNILGQPPVVTLGRVAHDVCSERGIPHGAVPHPQFIRRFHHREGDLYGKVILEAAQTQGDLAAWRP